MALLDTRSGRSLAFIGCLAWSALALTLAPRPADACGGFFCSQSQPVNQAAERIIFVDGGDGSVTAVVQILYDGPTELFSWVLPVPGIPDFDVSSNVAFQRLQNATNPLYNLQTVVEGECEMDVTTSRGGTQNADAGASPEDGGVTVVASGSVGPYQYEVLSVDPETEDPAQEALDWLTRHGYEVGDIGPDLLREYLEMGMNLLAFQLDKGASTGEIRPVILTYDSERPMIPIKLTAVAANDDMGVLVWVVAEARAIPDNYLSLELNEAAINWFNPGPTYNDVVVLAADEAGGQGFVTEYAAQTDTLADVVWSELEAQDFERLFMEGEWEGRRLQLLQSAISSYGGFDGFEETLRETVPLPAGVTPSDVVNCFACQFETEEDLAEMDEADFLQALHDNVVEPMANTQDLIDSLPYATRLYTTLSAREMTLDPLFDVNPDLADVSNVHTATRTIECGPGLSQADAPWRVELPQGGVVRGGGGQVWPFVPGPDMPANLLVREVGTQGEGEVVIDNTRTVTQALEAHNATVPGGGGKADDGCGCRATGPVGARGHLALFGLLAASCWIGRRRRK